LKVETSFSYLSAFATLVPEIQAANIKSFPEDLVAMNEFTKVIFDEWTE
jgi:hypothetical protein